jgi:WD40 repeat protein/serine/threonine protein kinase
MSADQSPADPVGVLAEEFVERFRRGERPALAEYIDRCPEQAERIRRLFPMLVVMEQAAPAGDASTDSTRDQAATARGPAPLPARVGGYRLVREIGRGGMGVVYEAEQLALGRHVALKVLPLRAAGDAGGLERFRREARAAARLHHSNIVPVYEVGEDAEVCYYAMQFIHGQPLDEVIEELRKLRQPGGSAPAEDGPGQSVARSLLAAPSPSPEPAPGAGRDPSCPGASSARSGRSAVESVRTHYHRSVARLGAQVAEALDYAHREGVIHRDVKPSNLLLDTEGRVWVADFGLAYQADAEARGEAALTRTGDVVGTVRYMAPERFRGWSDPRSDVYSLGLTLYELLALRPAFSAPDRMTLIQRVTQEEPPRLRKVDPAIPRDLETVVAKAIDKEPGRRYQTAGELAADLQRFLEDRPIQARPAGGAERAWRWCRRNPAVALLLAAVVLALSLGSAAATWFAVRAQASAELADEKAAEARAKERLAVEREGQADAARQLAERQLLRAEGLVYQGQLGRVEREWKDGKLALALTVLDSCRWDFRCWEHGHQRRLCEGSRATLHDEPGEVRALAFGAEGKTLVSAVGRAVAVWDVAARRRRLTLAGHQKAVGRVACSPDGRTIATAGHDVVILWDAGTGRELRRLEGTGCVAYSPDGKLVAAGSEGRTVRVWDAATGALHRDLQAGSSPVQSLALGPAPDGRGWLLATAAGTASFLGRSTNAEVKVWDLATGRPVWTTRPPNGATDVAFSPDGKVLAAAVRRHGAMLWDVATGRRQQVLKGPASAIERVAFRPGLPGTAGSQLATASGSTVQLWDTATGEGRLTFHGHTSTVYALAFTPDGQVLASGAMEGVIKLWDAVSGLQEFVLHDPALARTGQPRAHASSVDCVAFSPDSRLLATGGADKVVRLWDLASGRLERVLRGHTDWILSLAFSPDGSLLAVGGGEGLVKGKPTSAELRVWDVRTGAMLRSLRGHSAAVRSVAFSPDGKVLASGARDHTICLWDPSTGARLGMLAGHTSWVRSLAFSSDGKRLVSGGGYSVLNDAGEVKVWEVPGGRELLSFTGHNQGVRGVAINPGGDLIVSAGAEGGFPAEVKVWDAHTARELKALVGHTQVVTGVTFSPDGKRVATSSFDGTVKLWDLATGQDVYTLAAATTSRRAILMGLAFSPDGRYLASGLSDGTVRLWQAAPPEEKFILRGHAAEVWSVAVSADGRLAASGSGDPKNPLRNDVKVWDLTTGQNLFTWKRHAGLVTGVAFSPRGWLASASHDGTVRLWDPATGQELRKLLTPDGPAWCVAFSPAPLPAEPVRQGGKDTRWHLVAGSGKEGGASGTVTVWDAVTRERVHTLGGHRAPVRCLAYSPDGQSLATGDASGNVSLWDAATGRRLRTEKAHSGPVRCLAFGPGGLLASGDDRGVRVCEADSGRVRMTMGNAGLTVTGMAFSPDGKRLAGSYRPPGSAARSPGELKLWDTQTGREIRSYRAHQRAATCVAVTPDGRRLISGSEDRTVLVWLLEPRR